jgi:hypothetical protein
VAGHSAGPAADTDSRAAARSCEVRLSPVPARLVDHEERAVGQRRTGRRYGGPRAVVRRADPGAQPLLVGGQPQRRRIGLPLPATAHGTHRWNRERFSTNRVGEYQDRWRGGAAAADGHRAEP